MRTFLRARHLVLVALLFAIPAGSHAQVAVGVTITEAPPPLPVYEQPPCPTEGYLWTPGYWAHGPAVGYYWTPGVWVAPPSPGLLWTPGYWGFAGGGYGWHAGYWDLTSDFTAELITGSDTAVLDSGAGAGMAATSFTTPRRGTWAPVSTAYMRIGPLSARGSITTPVSTARVASAPFRTPENAPRCARGISGGRRIRSRIKIMHESTAAIMRPSTTELPLTRKAWA